MATLLIISSHAPYYTSDAQDALEAALAASNVGIEVTMVFTHKGLYQLLEEQESSSIRKKSIRKQLKVLPLYDIDGLYYIAEDASSLGLFKADLIGEVSPMDQTAFIQLCHSFDSVLRF